MSGLERFPNRLTHRAQHRSAAQALAADIQTREVRQPTGEEFLRARQATAAQRRDEQQRARHEDGTDRASARAWRAARAGGR